MSQSHYKILAKSPKDLRVRGDYLQIAIGNLILDADVVLDRYTEEVQHCILFETVYTNLWDHVVSTNLREPLLIDSNGFQHTICSLSYDAVIRKSKYLKEGTELPSVAEEIQGRAKSHGWIAFPKLKRSVVPHRLIFQFLIFDPGCTSGEVRHSETLELIFDLSLYGRLIGEGKHDYSLNV